MEQLKIEILSWLLFHANKGNNSEAFYGIKNKILEKYAVLLSYDLQHIEDKTCYSCNGSGWYDFKSHNLCWSCYGTGIYKKGFYTVLAKYYFNNYYFHKPFKKTQEKPDGIKVNINGYVKKIESKYTFLSRFILGILYGLDENTLLKSNYISVSWRIKWYYTENWLRSLLYIYSYKRFPPLSDLIVKVKNIKFRKNIVDDDSLPF